MLYIIMQVKEQEIYDVGIIFSSIKQYGGASTAAPLSCGLRIMVMAGVVCGILPYPYLCPSIMIIMILVPK